MGATMMKGRWATIFPIVYAVALVPLLVSRRKTRFSAGKYRSTELLLIMPIAWKRVGGREGRGGVRIYGIGK